MYISKGSQGHTSYSESWGKSIVSNWYLFFIRHKIIIFDFVSFACSGRAKTPTNTSIVWLFWGLRLPPGSGLQIVKHMIHWPGASWQGPGQVTDSARQKKLHFFFFSLSLVGPTPLVWVELWSAPHGTFTHSYGRATSTLLYPGLRFRGESSCK